MEGCCGEIAEKRAKKVSIGLAYFCEGGGKGGGSEI